MDFAGLDVHLAVASVLFADLTCERSVPTEVSGLVADGHLGAKSGFGLRGNYPPERRRALTKLRDEMLRRTANLRSTAETDLNQQSEKGWE